MKLYESIYVNVGMLAIKIIFHTLVWGNLSNKPATPLILMIMACEGVCYTNNLFLSILLLVRFVLIWNKCVCVWCVHVYDVCIIHTVVPALYGHLFDKCCYSQDDRDHDKYRIPIKLDTPSHPNVVINWPDVLWHTSVKATRRRRRRIINKFF